MRKVRRILGYARVSSVEQAIGTSLQDQQDAIRRHAKTISIVVTRMYVEAESGIHEKIERRDQIRALMADVRDGDLILCDKVDRWSRDPEFTYRSIREILSAGASFFAVGDNCDPSTPEGDTMLNFRVLFAREEHKRIKQRLVGTRRLLRARGYYADGLTPWGYRRQDVRGAERNTLILDDTQATRVLDAFKLCIAGKSVQEIAETLDIGRDKIFHALRNRVYMGQIRDLDGLWVSGRIPAIVDPFTFKAAQDALAARRLGQRAVNETSETEGWWLRDIALCLLCQAKMSSAYAGPKHARRYYYRCFHKCTKKYVHVYRIEMEASPIVEEHLASLREELSSARNPKRPLAKVSALALEAKQVKIRNRRERFLEAYADGLLTKDELRERMTKLDADLLTVGALAVVPPSPPEENRLAVLRHVNKLLHAWQKTTPKERRFLIGGLARSVGLAAGHAPQFDWFSPDELARRE